MLKFQFSKAITHLFDIKPASAKRRRGHRRQLSVEPLEQRTLLSAVTFSPAVDYSSASAGTNVRSVAVADLNGDGHADLVSTSFKFSGNTSINGTVSVRLGDGTGSFGVAANFGVGRAPYSVAIADVNGDGRPDLAVANRGSNSISVLLGTGTGSFGAATNFAAGNAPNSVATADVNGDGKPDIVAANVYGGNVSVILNTTATNSTTPTFGAPAYFTTGSRPFSVAIADLNGDGRPDVVTANLGNEPSVPGSVSVLLGTGPGTFSAPTNLTAGSVPDWVAIADVNGDGKPDLAVTNAGSTDVSILPGDGTGSFGTATNFSTVGANLAAVAVADLDGDGKLDVVTANQSIGNNSLGVSILLGDGIGTFGAATNLTAGTRPIGVAIADLNGDLKPDLVVANHINSVSVLLNTTTFSTVNFGNAILVDSPVGFWELNEAAGATSFIDSSVNGYTGTSLGDRSPISGVPGVACTTAAAFDGASNNTTSDVIQVPHGGSINFLNNFSFEAWVKWDGSNGYRVAVSKPSADNLSNNGTGSALGVYNGVPFFANGTTAGHANTLFYNDSAITVGVFHHLVGTFSSGVARIYVDGTLVSMSATAGETIYDNGTPASLNIGREFATRLDLSDRGFPGVIDAVAVYGSVLNSAQVLAHYNAGLAACVEPAVDTTTTVTAANATYDGLQHGATVVVDPGSAAGTTTFLYTGTGGTTYNSNVAPSNAGTYHVVATFTPANLLAYDPSTGSADYTIGKAAISYTIGDVGHVYGSTVDLTTALDTTFLTGVNGENLGIAYSSSGNTSTTNAGSYDITGLVLDGSGLTSNYIVTLTPGTLTVDKATISYTIDDAGYVYGSTVDLATALGTTFLTGVNGESLGIAYSSDGNTATANAGSYSITGLVSDGSGLTSNYIVTLTPGTLTVDKASIISTIGDAGHVYGSTVDLADTLGTTFLTGVNGENLGIAYSSDGNTSTANAGNYGITGLVSDGSGLASNYTVTLTSGTLTVSQAILTGNATTQDALNMAKQGKLTISVSNVSGLLNGDTLTIFLSTAEFYITVGENKYVFVPSTVTTSESSITVSYSLKNPALATSLAAELDDSTSAATAVSAGFYMESLNYTFFEDDLTRLFSTAK